MAEFCIKLAGIPFSVRSSFNSSKEFCREFLTGELPLFSVTVTPEHRERMRRQEKAAAEAEGRRSQEYSDSYMETLALCCAVTEKLAEHHVLLFHGSAVASEGKAYLFTAPSGTGKTTHSELWLKNIPGCHILNGDKPLLLFRDDRIYVCGSPWCGKENYGKNEILPLEAVCLLERATENHIEKITLNESFETLLKQCHVPEGNGNIITAVRLLKQLSAVPIYRLGCNMENEAAFVSYRGMVMKQRSFEELLEQEGKLLCLCTDSSMQPLIRDGKDFICIRRKPESGLKKHDAVLFRRPGVTGRGRYVLHRILKIDPDGTFRIVGDNSLCVETVREEEILGVLAAVIRNGKLLRVSDLRYRLYVCLWCAPWQLRFLYLKFRASASALLRLCCKRRKMRS